MNRHLVWLWHFFMGCPMEPWLRAALATKHEGVHWRCGCGRAIERTAKVVHHEEGQDEVS